MEDVIVTVIVVGAIALYLFPTYIAMQRHHHQSLAIFFLNLLLGWSLIGWVAALIWSMTAVKKELNKEMTKQCPACAETIMKAAKVCRYCGKAL